MIRAILGALSLCAAFILSPALAETQVAAAESPTEFNLRPAKAKPATPSTVPTTQPAAASTGVPCSDIINLLPLGCTPVNGGTPSPLSGPLQDAINFFSGSFDEATALAVQIPGLQDGNGQACWKQASSVSALLKAHPLILTLKAPADLEALRLFNISINQMCANSACTQVFTDITSAATKASLNVPIPSFTQICGLFPNIPIAPALPASSVTTPTPAAAAN